MKTYKNVDEYIQKADKEKQKILQETRKLIFDNFKKIDEKIAYGMPAYTYNEKPLFYFAAMKGHLGIYPTPGPITTLKKELSAFATSKGCVRVPYTTPLPKSLIIKLLKERMKEIKNTR